MTNANVHLNGAFVRPTVATVVASDGAMLPIDSLNQVPAYDSSNNMITLTVQYDPQGGTSLNTYVQTFTYTGGLLTNISGWVKQ